MSWWSKEEVAQREKAELIYKALFSEPKTSQEIADSFNITGKIKRLL